jgi:hypothetical protein
VSFLRFLSLLTLSAWVGGLAVLGAIGAPTIFSVLEGLDPHHGRDTAGRVFGAIFLQFQHAAWIAGALLVALLIARAVLGPRPRRFAWRMSALLVMMSLSLVSAFVLAPRIEAIRDATPGTIAALADDDPVKATFGRLHGLSNAFALLTILGGVWLIWIEGRDE